MLYRPVVMLKRHLTGGRDYAYTAPAKDYGIVEESNTEISEGNVMLHRVVQGIQLVSLKSCLDVYLSYNLSSDY